MFDILMVVLCMLVNTYVPEHELPPVHGALKGYETHMRAKSPYPVKNPDRAFFWAGLGTVFVFGAQEQLWTDALPDTANGPDGIQTRAPLTMSRKPYPLSHSCSQCTK